MTLPDVSVFIFTTIFVSRSSIVSVLLSVLAVVSGAWIKVCLAAGPLNMTSEAIQSAMGVFRMEVALVVLDSAVRAL